jgi:hypothetical protein
MCYYQTVAETYEEDFKQLGILKVEKEVEG